MNKTQISKADLQAHLDEQIQFLERSVASFDQGFASEAKRLAVVIRVFLHDTPSSHSLLGQLGLKSKTFLDSALPSDPNSVASYHGLVWVGGTPKTSEYSAFLDDPPSPGRQVSFDDWWSTPVIIDQKDRAFSRKDIVLAAANQDGGAHVDPKLDDAYAALAKHNSLSWYGVTTDGNAVSVRNPERATIRQIAHEVLKTLKPSYKNAKPAAANEIRIAGLTIGLATEPVVMPPRKMGRNEQCCCGSGRKYKHCHGRLVRSSARQLSSACVPETSEFCAMRHAPA